MPDPARTLASKTSSAARHPSSLFLSQILNVDQASFRRFFIRKAWFRQAGLVVFLLFTAGLGYSLLVFGLSLILGVELNPNHPFLIGTLVMALAWLLNPVRSRVEGMINKAFMRSRPAYTARLESFRLDLERVVDLANILTLLRQYAAEKINPSQLHVFLKDPLSGQYTATAGEDGNPTSDLRFQPDNPLVDALYGRAALNLHSHKQLSPELQTIQPRLAILRCTLYVPIPGQQRLLGWLAIGKRRPDESYTAEEVQYLAKLCSRAAVEIERAQVLADLQRRIREMDVLTRVAQGSNSTLAFDDILELVYTQTNQVIPTKDFKVILLDKDQNMCKPVFWLEGDERKANRENQSIVLKTGLEAEILHGQHPVVIVDYERECRLHDCLPEMEGIYAWIGVPLNTGAETIGVISLGSREPATVFTEEQGNLLQAIADQAAGAIVKTRLLQEMEQHSRQLTILNEIGRSLTSTLDLNILLEQVLKNAMKLANCLAGALFLVEEGTGDLVFEAGSGLAEAHLVGKHLPAGTGPAGEAALKKHAVTFNELNQYPEWYSQIGRLAGFVTLNVMAIPLLLQDRVVGVIEVIQKTDGLLFDHKDEDILTTFASQATIAVENARLYTLTDQALSARVEELSAMQNIDRNLNASLELERTLQITLEWAMSQSEATAGLVAILEDGVMIVKTSQGYQGEQVVIDGLATNDLAGCKDGFPGIQQALQTGQPQRRHLKNTPDGHHEGLLTGAIRQLVFPIRREGKVIALMLLESDREETCAEESMELISRFSDHAAIAIANAQLYAQVQEANLAKSKFVSFVAHELKNPMASIKGYTELIAGGMAGPVNSMQASFLATVRSNVDRMNTIVSDLNDLTKIQVGSLRLEFRPVSVEELIEEVIRTMQRLIEEKGLRLAVIIPENLPKVWGDPVRLGQILTNLISNAQKYTPEGGEITVGCEHCWTAAKELSEWETVHIWVKDTGIGIPPDDQGKIFQPYFRTEISKEAANGTGLGLNITRSLVEMQAGTIWFESEPGTGTTFHFTVPVPSTV